MVALNGSSAMTDEAANHRGSRQAIALPKFPGENPVLHEGVQFWEATQTRLATAGLAKAADGKIPDKAAALIDTDLNEIPVLPIGHRDHERRNEVRLVERKKNAVNRRKRYEITMEQRTAVFSSLYESAEASGAARRCLRANCARRATMRVTASTVATLMVHWPTALCTQSSFSRSARRATQADVDFYDTAKTLLKKSTLSDGCKASDFMAKAYAWIYKIRPHLAQTYDDEQAAEYLIALMPRRLGSDARRIFDKFEESGTLGNLMQLARELEKVVYKDQSATPPATALVQLDAGLAAQFDTLALSEMTGMAFAAPGSGQTGGRVSRPSQRPSVKLLFGVGGKWCSDCGKHENCFFNPQWPGPLPVFIHESAERKKLILKGRADNAKGADPPVQCATLKAPSAEAIKAFKERRKAGRGAGRGAKGLLAEGTPGGAALDWHSTIEDITDVTLAGMCHECERGHLRRR